MTYEERDKMLATKANYVTEREEIITPAEYLQLQKQMVNQGTKDKIHILSMNYTPSTGELKISRRYFT